MGRMKALAEELEELRRCGETLIEISETLTRMFSTTANFEGAMAQQEAPQQKTKPEAEPQPKEDKAEPQSKPLTLEEVRPILAEKSRAGHTAAIKEILKKHGAPNLSGIDPAEYPALLAEVEVL